MKNLVLYCKSYRNDLHRVVNLSQSVAKFNRDGIPFYVSVPKSDVQLFVKNLDSSVVVLEDESIYSGTAPGWIQQQIVKSNFWKLELAENYLCLDSDAYFIKPFYIEDFMYDDSTPYTVIHQQRELFTWTSTKVSELGFNPKVSFTADRQKIMNIFGRTGRYYDFGPSPVLWSSKVWKSLEENYTTPNGLSFENLIEHSHSEFSWYGEALLAFKPIEIYPTEPLFKVFHYPQQLLEYKQQGVTEDMIADNYLGIIMQSNFNAPLTY